MIRVKTRPVKSLKLGENTQNPSTPWISTGGASWKTSLSHFHLDMEDSGRITFRESFWTTQIRRAMFLLWQDSPCVHRSCSGSVCRLGMHWQVRILLSSHARFMLSDQKSSSGSCLSKMLSLCLLPHCSVHLHTWRLTEVSATISQRNYDPTENLLNPSQHNCTANHGAERRKPAENQDRCFATPNKTTQETVGF